MGSENSKKSQQNPRDSSIPDEVAQAMQKRRITYEIQYEELRNEYLRNRAANINTSQLNNQSINSSMPLYPNLNVVNNNMQTTAVYTRPSTNFTPSPPNDPGTSYGQSTSRGHASSYQPQPTPSAPPMPSAPPVQLSKITEIKRDTSLSVSKHPSSNSARNVTPKKTGQSIVDCVTCKNNLDEQIYQCKNGHSSCKECRLKMAKCGVCLQIITDMRNITLEATLAGTKPTATNQNVKKIKCRNEGCNAFIQKHLIRNHSKECPFKDISCATIGFLGICTWKGKLTQLLDHFNKFHKEHREADVNKEMSLTNITEDEIILYLVNIGKFHFLVHIQINSSQETVSMMVQLIGTKNVASRWSYEFQIYGKDQPRRYQHIDICHSHAESVKEIIDTKNCVVLSTKYAKTFHRNGQLFYKFYIKQNNFSRTQHGPN